MNGEAMVDLFGEILFCCFAGVLTILVFVWGWWTFRLYFPKKARLSR
jgi:hypothetical protein